ncbi:MAG: D-sedoheptulose 7-phosphate isomerase [Candidatus Margulisiibacteriota bacterium]
MKDMIKQHIIGSIEVKNLMLSEGALVSSIGQISEVIVSAYRNGNKVLIAGNGGSAADSQHMAAEFVSRFNFDRPALPSIALTTDTSMLTAIGNDYGFDKVFSRQIEANGAKGDVFIGISTSGNSQNIIEGLKTAKARGLRTIGFTNKTGGKMAQFCDHCIKVPSMNTPRVQECHILIAHIICAVVEDKIFGKEYKK